jgi:hypothetical protein
MLGCTELRDFLPNLPVNIQEITEHYVLVHKLFLISLKKKDLKSNTFVYTIASCNSSRYSSPDPLEPRLPTTHSTLSIQFSYYSFGNSTPNHSF